MRNFKKLSELILFLDKQEYLNHKVIVGKDNITITLFDDKIKMFSDRIDIHFKDCSIYDLKELLEVHNFIKDLFELKTE